MRRLSIALVISTLSASASAQRTWIIDAANRPGTDFTDIPAGAAAAADGDTLLVRAGNYSPFSTSKGIAVLGVPGQTRVVAVLGTAIFVSGVPRGRTFSARGLLVSGQVPGTTIAVQNNPGHVHFEEIDVPSTASPMAQITISGSSLVTVLGCGLQSQSFTVNATGSRVAIARSRLTGWSALSDPRAGSRSAEPGLMLRQGSVGDLADCVVTGGNGASVWPNIGQFLSSAPAVGLDGSNVRVRAGTARTLTAGVGATTTLPVSAIRGTGTAQVDTRIVLSSYAGAPPIDASVQATIGLVPGLSLAGGTLGTNFTATHQGRASQPCILAAGVAGPVQSFPFGDLVLDLATMQLLPLVFADAAGVASWTLPVPMNGSLVGATITWQVGSDANGLMLSNAAAVVLN